MIAVGFLLAVFSGQAICWQAASPQSTPLVRQTGTVKSIAGATLGLTTDSGSLISVVVQSSARLLRIAPGQTDLKNAAAIQLGDIQVGDRILVRGSNSEDGKATLASSVILMKQSDLAEKRQREQAEWREHGVGGLVSAVDAASGTVSISTGVGGSKALALNTSKDTVLRRYAPDSITYDDAKPGALDQIKVGDQLRARGALNAERSEMNAQEIVFGTFRNIAGTIAAVDPQANSLTVFDLSIKKTVRLRLSSDSQMRKLPSTLAERVAARVKRTSAGESTAAPARADAGPPGGFRGPEGGGQTDLQQILQRLPATTLAELNKGEAVMIVSTQGTDTEQPTVITLLSGVEPILTASPNNSSAALSTWNLASSIGDAAAQ